MTAGDHHAAEAVANAAERRWAIIVGAIIASLLAMMIFTSLHWAAMPPSRVETVDVRTLHIKGEFVGGADIVREMYAQGELQKLIDSALA